MEPIEALESRLLLAGIQKISGSWFGHVYGSPSQYELRIKQNGTNLKGKLTGAGDSSPFTGTINKKGKIVIKINDDGTRATIKATVKRGVMTGTYGAVFDAGVFSGAFNARRI
jgi:hypothetical protein